MTEPAAETLTAAIRIISDREDDVVFDFADDAADSTAEWADRCRRLLATLDAERAELARLRRIEEAARDGFAAFEAWARGERNEWGQEHAALRDALAEPES